MIYCDHLKATYGMSSHADSGLKERRFTVLSHSKQVWKIKANQEQKEICIFVEYVGRLPISFTETVRHRGENVEEN